MFKDPAGDLRVRAGCGPKAGNKTRPRISGEVTTNRRTTIPNDSWQICAFFGDDPKLFNCEMDQSSSLAGGYEGGHDVR